MQGEKERVWLSVFSTEQSALSDGRRQICTDYHGAVKHEVTALCVGCDGEGEKNTGKQRKRQRWPLIICCHLYLSLYLQKTSRLVIWNNKQKQVNIQLQNEGGAKPGSPLFLFLCCQLSGLPSLLVTQTTH